MRGRVNRALLVETPPTAPPAEKLPPTPALLLAGGLGLVLGAVAGAWVATR